MDLLFKRYASPFLILQQMIDAGRFDEYVSELIDIRNDEIEEDTLWDMYLQHQFLDISFDDYKTKLGIRYQSHQPVKADFETTVKDSMSILNDFVPE